MPIIEILGTSASSKHRCPLNTALKVIMLDVQLTTHRPSFAITTLTTPQRCAT